MEGQCNILFGFAFTLSAVLTGQTSTCLAFKEDLNDQNWLGSASIANEWWSELSFNA
jgi:hypothetical protein